MLTDKLYKAKGDTPAWRLLAISPDGGRGLAFVPESAEWRDVVRHGSYNGKPRRWDLMSLPYGYAAKRCYQGDICNWLHSTAGVPLEEVPALALALERMAYGEPRNHARPYLRLFFSQLWNNAARRAQRHGLEWLQDFDIDQRAAATEYAAKWLKENAEMSEIGPADMQDNYFLIACQNQQGDSIRACFELTTWWSREPQPC